MRPTRSPRALALGALAALGAALPLTAAAPAAPADAAGLRHARFWATYSVERLVDWEEPRWQTFQDCWHTWWYAGNGFENEVHESTVPVKVLASGTGGRGSVFFKFRTWDPFAESGIGMPGMAEVRRDEVNDRTWTAGSCGVRGEIVGRDGNMRMTPDPPLPDDCGRRSAAMETRFDVVGERLHLNSFLGPRQEVEYESCDMTLPTGLDVRGVPDAVSTPFSGRDLFDARRRVLVFRGFRRYAETRPGGGRRRVTGTVSWTLTLRRVVGSARPRR